MSSIDGWRLFSVPRTACRMCLCLHLLVSCVYFISLPFASFQIPVRKDYGYKVSLFSHLPQYSRKSPLTQQTRYKQSKKICTDSVWSSRFGESTWERLCLFLWPLQHSLHGHSPCYHSTGTPVFPGNHSGLQRSFCCPAARLQTGTDHWQSSPGSF